MESLSTKDLKPTEPSTLSPSWKVKLLYDGECPLCVREVNFLTKKDAGRGLIAFVDIADDNYNPSENAGISFETAMGRIHAILPDGTIIQNLEVFRQVYDVLGIGWIYAPSKWPIIGKLLDRVYDIWADWRLKFTGRPSLNTLIEQRQQRLECQNSDRCRI